MGNADITRDKLIAAATQTFWEQGYSNTSLRRIALAASVDVALISRYFGGKLGLFKATLTTAFEWPELVSPDNDPIEVVINKYANPASDAHQTSVIRMIVMNANDPQVGELVRQTLRDTLLDPLEARMGGPKASERLAMFIAVVIGASMVRQSLQLPGMATAEPDLYARQLRHLIEAALNFREDPADL
ncbi:TetR/AcrR family transcriptional regulator [Roseibium algae]|uniref:TetR family transcriptional regulator n=1 Tax=Roseibium algae TaxID=3123038 RepID=A0ABU8TNZ4_9HYPH